MRQWLDLISQFLYQFPTHFEFNEEMLVCIADALHSCLYGTFLGNSEKERKVCNEFLVNQKKETLLLHFLYLYFVVLLFSKFSKQIRIRILCGLTSLIQIMFINSWTLFMLLQWRGCLRSLSGRLLNASSFGKGIFIDGIWRCIRDRHLVVPG